MDKPEYPPTVQEHAVEDPGPRSLTEPYVQGARQSARGAIEARIKRLHYEIDGLEALLKAFPAELPRDADAALYKLLDWRS